MVHIIQGNSAGCNMRKSTPDRMQIKKEADGDTDHPLGENMINSSYP